MSARRPAMIEGGKPFSEVRPGISEEDASGDAADARLQGSAERGRRIRRGAGEDHGLIINRHCEGASDEAIPAQSFGFALRTPRNDWSDRYAPRNDETTNGGNNHVPGKTRRSRLSPGRRAQAIGFSHRGIRAADAGRGPGPVAHHLAVARSLYARADERRAVLCGAGADRRRHGGRHGVRGDRLEQSRLCQGRHRAVARRLADACAVGRQGTGQDRPETRDRSPPRSACSACPA